MAEETLPFTGFRVDPLVIHPRRDHLDRAGAGEHLTRGVGTIAHHQAMPVLAAFADEAGDVGVDLGLQRLGQHPAGTLTHDLVDQRRRRRCAIGGVVTVGGIRDYGEHRDVPSRPALPRRSSLEPSFGHPGRYAPSRADPQISSIAPGESRRATEKISDETEIPTEKISDVLTWALKCVIGADARRSSH
jgi:hypothetical protein